MRKKKTDGKNLLRDCLKLLKINYKEAILKCSSASISEKLLGKTLNMGED